MVDSLPVWILDKNATHVIETRAALSQRNLTLWTFTTADAILTAARSSQARLPQLLVATAELLGEVKRNRAAPPRAALLLSAPCILLTPEGTPPTIGPEFSDLAIVGASSEPLTPASLLALVATYLPNDVASEAGREEPDAKALVFDVTSLTVRSGGTPAVTLTPREFQILRLIHRGSGASATRAELFSMVWSDVRVCNKVLDVHMSKLRRKLMPIGATITFERPSSYRLQFPVMDKPSEHGQL